MLEYSIRKISMDRKIINKKLTLNVQKYTADPNILYFDVDNYDLPYVINYNNYFEKITNLINDGLIKSISYNNGVLNVVSLEGYFIKNYIYDFNFSKFDLKLHNKHFDYLEKSLLMLITLYQENPSAIMSMQSYIAIIGDIIDGDNIPIIDDDNVILNILEFYTDNRALFINILSDKVTFFDDNGNVIDYNEGTRQTMIDNIIPDIVNQMESAIIMFIQENNKEQLYQNYLDNLYIPRRELSYEEDNQMTLTKEGGN